MPDECSEIEQKDQEWGDRGEIFEREGMVSGALPKAM